MTGPHTLSMITCLAGLLGAPALCAGDSPVSVDEHLRVPAGFVVERAAGPPLIQRPMFAAFDAAGRLYVIDSGGVNDKNRHEEPPDAIRRLEDTDGDGVFDQSSLFADKIVFGAGLLCYRNAVFVASPPSLWKLEDADGDGVCDRRTELVTGFAYKGSCSDDFHGACLGPDGRVYFMPGRFHHAIRQPGGPVLREGNGPWLMRCRPDGRDIEFVCGCVGNPVEVDFFPNGDFFVQGTYWAKPSMGGALRDAVIHGVEGGEYSVRDRDYTDRIRTGDFLNVLVPMGATAPSGMTVYRSDAFGDAFRHNLFGSYFNTHTIQRHVLRRDGASYRAESEDFVIGLHADIHFTDVLEDANGSLLAVDTGGWFRVCCPTSQIAKPEVFGGIYRVRRENAAVPSDPRGLGLAWTNASIAALAERLDDDRPAVRERAIDELALRGAAAVGALAKVVVSGRTPEQRCGAIWALCRMDDRAARAAARPALADADSDVRQAALAGIALHRDASALPVIRDVVRLDPSPAVRREAANALGRIADKHSVPILLDSLAKQPDPYLEHALIYALIRIGDADLTRRGLQSRAGDVRRGALIALDQMTDGRLKAQEVTAQLTSNNERLHRAAVAVLTKHAEWADSVVPLLDQWLDDDSFSKDQAATIVDAVRIFRDEPSLHELVGRKLADRRMSSAARLILLDAAAATALQQIPPAWSSAVERLLTEHDRDVRLAAARAVETLRLDGLDPTLHYIAQDSDRDSDTRLAALRALAARRQNFTAAEFDFLMSRLEGGIPISARLAGLDVIAMAAHDEERLVRLAAHVADCGPVELPRLLSPFALANSDRVGKTLVASLLESKVPLSKELLDETLKSYSASVLQAAAPLVARVDEEQRQQRERLALLESAMVDHRGNLKAGRELFFGKANCHLCHQIDDRGGKVGPNLTGIGAIRTRRDLLEAVVFPSVSFARGYEPVNIVLVDGRVRTGLMGREDGEAAFLIEVQQNKPVEVRIERGQIEEIQLARVSPMPQGLDRQLSQPELADLIAFLEGQKELAASPGRQTSRFEDAAPTANVVKQRE